jgi:hypothetical protein
MAKRACVTVSVEDSCGVGSKDMPWVTLQSQDVSKKEKGKPVPWPHLLKVRQPPHLQRVVETSSTIQLADVQVRFGVVIGQQALGTLYTRVGVDVLRADECEPVLAVCCWRRTRVTVQIYG